MQRLLTFLLLAAAVPVRAQFEEARPALSAIAGAANGQRALSAAARHETSFQVPIVDLGNQYQSGICYAHTALGYVDVLAELYGQNGEKTFYPKTILILLSLDTDTNYLEGRVAFKSFFNGSETLFDGGSMEEMIGAMLRHPEALIPVSPQLDDLIGGALLFRETVYENSKAAPFRKKLARNLHDKIQKALNGRLRTEALAFVADLGKAGFTLDDASRSVVYARPATPAVNPVSERLKRKNLGPLKSTVLQDLPPARCEETVFRILKTSLENGFPVILSIAMPDRRLSSGQPTPRHAMIINRLFPAHEGYQTSAKNSWAGQGNGVPVTHTLRALCRPVNAVILSYGPAVDLN